MRGLTSYELEVLKRGAQEERNGVQVHRYPANETEDLLSQYYAWLLEDYHCDYEIVISALHRLYDFWACYFACGADCAFAIKEEEDKRMMEELEVKIAKWQEEANRRLEQEVKDNG